MMKYIHTATDSMVYATNNEGEGLFRRFPSEGAYRQLRGCSQTPRFRTLDQFRRYVRRITRETQP